MAFTIRELSEDSEENLKRLTDNNKSFLTTKTKAIDYVLKNFYSDKEYLKRIEKENDIIVEKLKEKNSELIELKRALKIIFDSIKNIN